MKKILIIAALGLCTFASNVRAFDIPTQGSTVVKPALTNTVNCQTVSSNLPASVLITNYIPQRQHIGVGVAFGGQNASNTGTVGLQWAPLWGGTNKLKSTTKTITTTHTANGTTAVLDWAIITDSALGPPDALVLVGITNAVVNVNSSSPAGGILFSNSPASVWLQWGAAK
jgi:hypothetical protein